MKPNPLHKGRSFHTGKDLINLLGRQKDYASPSERIAPSNDIEQLLSGIWEQLLHHNHFGTNDDFFKIGGDSIKAVQLVSRIRKALSVHLQLTDIFLQPTIRQLATCIQGREAHLGATSTFLPKSRPAHIPLSFSQERLWFIHELEGSIQYHTPDVFHLTGDLNLAALEFALTSIVNRHEVLRTVIREENNTPYQYIKEKDNWQLKQVDGSRFQHDAPALQAYIDGLIKQPFDLASDDMIRGHLIKLGGEEHILVVTMHHIASDGWSLSILVEELVKNYKSYIDGHAAPIELLPIQYADYAIWQRQYLQGEVLNKKIAYWKDKLDGVAPLQLPYDYPRPPVQSTKGAMTSFMLDKGLSDRLQQLSHDQNTTLYMTLLSVFKVLLYRYSGQEDICVGTPIAGRQQQEVEHLIGFFVNTLALRSEVKGSMTFTELLQGVRATTLEAYEHQEAPFEKIVEAVVKERDMSRNPLFQVLFVLQNTPEIPKLDLQNLVLSKQDFAHETSIFDLSFFITETNKNFQVAVEYCTDLYREDTIQRMLGHYNVLLQSVVNNPSSVIGEIPMLTGAEESLLLNDFNRTLIEYPRLQSLTDIFEAQVASTPDAIALVFGEEQLTFRELNEKANELAHFLISQDIAREELIPICIERGAMMIIGLLGILKAGGAFVPIDPDYPIDRINYMLENSSARIIISSKIARVKLEAISHLSIISLDEDAGILAGQSKKNCGIEFKPNSLSYVIHTSGSTGKPKGVMIEQESLINLLKCIIKEVEFTPDGSFLSVTTFSFDICYLELFVPLISGGKLIIVSREVAMDGFKLAEHLSLFNPTHMQGTPATWSLLLDTGWKNEGGMKILIGGEAVTESIKDRLTEMGSVFNLYGPTETTIWSTIKNLERNTKVSIGKPIANTRIYIINEQLQLSPLQVPGEICIAGDGLARGYLNLADLTAQKFIRLDLPGGNAERIYRTGDLGRWLPDGNIEYSRRADDQVKIRGYRIEPGEIETVLHQCDFVSQAVILVKGEKENNKRLVGYYVPVWQHVKEKERELYDKQVSSWKEIYETEYATAEKPVDAEFDIAIWNDSFSGEPIAQEEMGEWLADVVDKILSENPDHVLEVGCGSGLIYYQLAGKLKKYIGTDFSRASITHIQDRINKGLRNYGPTELKVCAAHEISLFEDQQIDTIVLNSIIQYFPGENYMTSVISKGIELLKGQGRIVIGDVRDYRLLALFKTRLQLQKLQHSTPVEELQWQVDQEALKEEELLFSPEYFLKLKEAFPEITYIEMKWKNSSFINELTLYRYTVVLYIGIEKDSIEPDWLNWDEDTINVANKAIQEGQSIVALRNVPNFRLWKEQLLHKTIKERTTATVGSLINTVNTETKDAVEVKDLIDLATSSGYRCELLLTENPFLVNVVFHLNELPGFVVNPYFEEAKPFNGPFTNTPLFNDISILLQKDIKSFLQQRLPDYMIPSDLTALAQLPLTNNGKVNRRFLSQREDKATFGKADVTLPRNEVEQALAVIWQDLLGLAVISVDDNFFEIGGHSLLATRVISSMRNHFDVELSVKDLFLHPTIGTLALHLGAKRKGLLLPSIVREERPPFIPLSFSQQRLWFIDRLEGSSQYHIPLVLKLQGKVSEGALLFSLQSIVDRHEVLRTVIREEEDGPTQVIPQREGAWQLHLEDGSRFNGGGKGLDQYLDELINRPFDLTKDYMLRASLISLHPQDHVLVVTMHHIASDGWSMSVFVREFTELYTSYTEGRPSPLSPLEIQYADYALWQRKYLGGEVLDEKLRYWKEKLSGVEPLQLSTDYVRPAVQSTKGALLSFTLDKGLKEGLQHLSTQQGTTLFMTLLAAFKVLLHKYSGQRDICVGTVISERGQRELEQLIGFFVNTLALRSGVDSDGSFTDFLQQVRTTTLEGYENQEAPFEKVVQAVVKERDMSRNPLFQVMFVWQNTDPVPEITLGEAHAMEYQVGQSRTKFDITFIITENDDHLQGLIEYSTDLYDKETIERLSGHFRELLISILKKPEQQISSLSILTAKEAHDLLVTFNNTGSDFAKDKTLIALFEEQAETNPSSIALNFDGKNHTYKEVNERANQLAHYLLGKGLKNESPVPIYLKRSPELIIGILAILKAGGAYVPIDINYPEDRVNFMLEDIGATMIISNKDSDIQAKISKPLVVIELDNEWFMNGQQPVQNPGLEIASHQLAYIIYTSGSTGKPKGVMIEHNGITNLISWHKNEFEVSGDSRATSMAGVGFDAFGWEVWPYLSSGASVFLMNDELRLDPCNLMDFFTVNSISHSFIPTALVADFINISRQKKTTLQFVLTGGDRLPSLDIQGIDFTIVNNYGPTEYSVVTTSYKLTQEIKSNPPIGRPIANTTIKIGDGHQNLVPVGIPGEIYITGEGLARGYLNQETLTREKFSFVSFGSEQIKMYQSGDIGRWLPDGTIEYLGRVDDQVKIRGYRIELGEIESVLQLSGMVSQAVVVVREDNNTGKQLVAYVVSDDDLDKQEITAYLQTKLPRFMIPSVWVQLPALPLTPNGKIDKKSLPEPDASALLAHEYVAPGTEVEEKLAIIWKDLLHLERVGVHDDFFELGGHSLLAKRMTSYIEKSLFVSVPIPVVFQFTTISELGKYLETQLSSYSKTEESAGFKFLDI